MTDTRSLINRSAAGVLGLQHLHEDGSLTIENVQDVEPILEDNIAEANDNGFRPFAPNMRKVASIPMIFVQKWRDEGLDLARLHEPEMWRLFQAKINSPDYRKFKTSDEAV